MKDPFEYRIWVKQYYNFLKHGYRRWCNMGNNERS